MRKWHINQVRRTMRYYCFEIVSGVTTEDAWKVLKGLGYELLYAEEEPEKPAKLYGYPSDGAELQKSIEVIAAVTDLYFEEIDWPSQWQYAGGDSSGTLQIDLKSYFPSCSKALTLLPGPGFGDFSHPTTRLVLQLMAPHINGKCFLDIGCGSGILGLAALSAGALHAHAIDIDGDALRHTYINAQNNGLEAYLTLGYPGTSLGFPTGIPCLAAMNMISSEQEIAWKSLQAAAYDCQEIITSGVLASQRLAYLELCGQWGWRLLEESKMEGWLGFRFECGEFDNK